MGELCLDFVNPDLQGRSRDRALGLLNGCPPACLGCVEFPKQMPALVLKSHDLGLDTASTRVGRLQALEGVPLCTQVLL